MDAAADLDNIFSEDLEVGLAFDKLTTVGSSQFLADTVARRLGVIGVVAVVSVPNLGIDYAPGRVRY